MSSNDKLKSSNAPKPEVIADRQSKLPLPDDPPVASDFNSSDASTTAVGSGGVQSDVSYGGGSETGLRGPATSDSALRTDGAQFGINTSGPGKVGREGKDGLEGLPADAKKS
ncbi:MAG: hypothetical protein L6R36_006530 [Xanthoria steineri]|nr:MAG: hypothetical protein L6R36_006530 [Xanthoria steineri]